MSQAETVAIIGAGLAGLALSLALHQQGIKSTIFESRAEPLNIGGAVMLSPNALRILDKLGLYQRIKSLGYNFDDLEFRTVEGTLIDTYEFGSESKYGYSANRIYRFELIDILLDAVKAQGIEVIYGKKFAQVTHESKQDVTFSFTDGSTTTTSLLIGADGIHSTVRKYLYPNPEHSPKFIGQAGITAAVPATNLPNHTITKPLTIVSPGHGAFVIAPQTTSGSELLIGKQKRIPGPAPTRESWAAIHADKSASIAFLQSDNSIFGALAASATSHIPADKINVWPFFTVPRLPSWTSTDTRVILVGDAAHAIPPSAGQGISQAMEDVYMLALLVGEARTGKVEMAQATGFWQMFRQDRVNKVLELNARVDKRRLPNGEGKEVEREEWELGWLYDVDVNGEVERWVAGQVED